MVNKPDGKKLIALARQSISSHFQKSKADIPADLAKKYSAPQGAFVTLTIDGELRGCIGYVEPVFPLVETIRRAAAHAAFEDPRFPPLRKDELDKIKIEVSILTLPELIDVDDADDYLKRIEIGKDGLIIRSGETGRSGLLLPQVFTEYGCSPKMALEMTCQKAGLRRDAWEDLSNKVFKFHAEIFTEGN